MIRLRQIALVARDLDSAIEHCRAELGVEVCFRDPGVAEFGLHNALFAIGDQFLEIVSPTQDGTTAGRLLTKRGGDGGYMAIFEVDDLDRRLELLDGHGVRVVWSGDFADIRGRHLHPRDVGGTLVSLDEPVPWGSWRWGGPGWRPTSGPVAGGIAGATIGASDPDAMRRRWEQLDLTTSVDFAPAGDRGDGLDQVDLIATDRRRAGDRIDICGVSFRLV